MLAAVSIVLSAVLGAACPPDADIIDAGATPFTAHGSLLGIEQRIDAYRFTFPERAAVSLAFDASFVARLTLLDSGNCDAGVAILDSTHTSTTPTEVGGTINPGTYLLLVERLNPDPHAGSPDEYTLSVSLDPLVPCCVCEKLSQSLRGCTRVRERTCHELGGVSCIGSPCEQSEFELIPFGNPDITPLEPRPWFSLNDSEFSQNLEVNAGHATILTILGPETDLINGLTGEPLELPFRFFGELRDRIAISPEGRITFPIGTTAAPPSPPSNQAHVADSIAPYWTDLNLDGGGSVRISAGGAHSFRALVIEFDGVPLASDPSTRVSFQVILFESQRIDSIRFNYRSLPRTHADAFIGLASPDGTTLVTPAENVLAALNTSQLAHEECLSIDFIQRYSDDCEFGVCHGDDAGRETCDGDCRIDGMIDFVDLQRMLTVYGKAFCTSCDADNNLVVDFNDLLLALFRFGPCPAS